MKLLWNILSIYGIKGQIEIFRAFFKHFGEKKNDKGLGVIVGSFFKDKFAKLNSFEDVKAYLTLAEEEILPLCLDTLKEGADFILDMTERITSTLNLYIFAVIRCKKEGDDFMWAASQSKELFAKKYFQPLLSTIEAGFTSCDDQEKEIETQPEALRQGTKNKLDLKRRDLEVIKQTLAQQISNL